MENELDKLSQTGRALIASASRIQESPDVGAEFPRAEREQLAEEVSVAYHAWFAKAQAALPVGDQEEFTKPYYGGLLSNGIKDFLSEPLKQSPLYSPSQQIFDQWAYPFAKTFKQNMNIQLMVIDRRSENRPAIIKTPDGDVRLPRNLKGHQAEIEAFLAKHPFESNVFLMMKYRDSNHHIAEIIRSSVELAGLNLVLAKDTRITDELATNVVACLLCCKFGIALFDEPEDAQHINPNVAYELGMMHLMDRPCLLLKSNTVQIQSDLLAKLYVPYDPVKSGDIIARTKKWLTEAQAIK